MPCTMPLAPGLPLFELGSTRVGHRVVLKAKGEIDLAGAPELSRQGRAALADGAGELWIDLTGVEFIDLIAARVLVELHELAAADGHRVTVICPDVHVRKALDLSGTACRLDLCGCLAEAHRLA
jgi:anti-anti-sigma factor